MTNITKRSLASTTKPYLLQQRQLNKSTYKSKRGYKEKWSNEIYVELMRAYLCPRMEATYITCGPQGTVSAVCTVVSASLLKPAGWNGSAAQDVEEHSHW